ncbi:hypothetical protein J19TS2_47670 [Cohnella xylanilytica]|uniref:YrdB family protein n=1 Tax=Cohnella xylanilytica TaxID=557555 RepID=A0A841U5W9_9BACL|nr:YrdB family protein [Cohnella xylanilytica]MBB6693683.1 YrdB family protein [Cohnella xylanilytica]GIO15212.1 hypothetical protein J19TS2_47670 [Cohnella xylanilytica]
MAIAGGIVLGALFLVELAALASYSYWGFRFGSAKGLQFLLGIGAPALVAIFWGMFVAPKASISVSVPVRALLQAVVFAGAAGALYAAGRPAWAVAFLLVAAVVMSLVYLLKL